MTDTSDQIPTLGETPVHQRFAARHPRFVAAYLPNTNLLIDAYVNSSNPKGSGTVLRALGIIALEGFGEIVVLCANGYPSGALKILRPMYENTVTLAYLHRSPDEIVHFLGYYPVAYHKDIQALKSAFPNHTSHQERLERLRPLYESALPNYLQPACSTCAKKVKQRTERAEPIGDLCTHTRTFSWTKKSLPELAEKAGGFTQIAPVAYNLPIQETHASASAVWARLDVDLANRTVAVKTGAEARDDRLTLFLAHYLAMRTLEVFREAFALESVEPELWETCVADLREHQDSLLPRTNGHGDSD